MLLLSKMSSFLFLFVLMVCHSIKNSDAFAPTPSQSPSITNSMLPSTTTPSTTMTSRSRRYYYPEDKDSITSSASASSSSNIAEQQRRDWINRSITYYSKVMREERRRNLGQLKDYDSPTYQQEFSLLAKKHYFALRKIKDGKPAHAERIYRRIIHEIIQNEQDEAPEGDHCDHANLAITTLLLALHLQRTGAPPKRTRSVFLNFFRVAIVENGEENCACSAKVLQAFALFEMKQGNRLKSLQLVKKAIQLDLTLKPVLKWKQFRDASERMQQKWSSHDNAQTHITSKTETNQ